MADETKEVPTTDIDQNPELTEEKKAEAVMGYDQQIATLQDAASRYAPETDEQRKKRERREKSKKIIAAVTDGIGALSNLFFTTQYAPNMYNHEKANTLTPLQKKLDEAKAQREKDADKYLNYSLQMGNAANQRAATLREMEAQAEKQKLAREKADREKELQDWKRALQPDKEREQAGKADRAEYEAETARVKSEWEPQQQQATLAKTNAQTTAAKASANASNASAAKSRAEAGAVREFSAWDENGREHKFKTEAAAIAYAKQHGTYEETDQQETSNTSTTNSRGKTSTSTKTTTKKKGHAGKPSPTGGKQSPTQ